MEEISIGEFSRRSHLSPRALRLYDKRGVLVPSRVDQGSGYRYHDAAHLAPTPEDVGLRITCLLSPPGTKTVPLRDMALPIAVER